MALPLFNPFEEKVMGGVKQVKNAWKGGWLKRLILVLYLAVVLGLIIVGIFFIIGGVVNGLEAVGLIKENIYAPKKELVYSNKVENIKENGDYVTTFDLKISSPQGQMGGMYLLSYPKSCDYDNIVLLKRGGTELKNGTIYSVDEYKITCVTKKPLTENNEGHLLFKLK